jgi:hypothetical protein
MEPQKNMDVRRVSDRSIRKIPLRGGRRVTDKQTKENIMKGEMPPQDVAFVTPPQKSKTLLITIITIASVVLLGVLYQMLFTSGKLVITPKYETVAYDKTITTKKDSEALPFETMSIERTATREAQSSGEQEEVSTKASGTIIVYNNFSATPQKLIANTRFESQDGHVFRIQDAISVPGITNNASGSVPGSLEVKVYADTAGEDYNIGLSDFTLPALKGDSRFEKIYARSKEPMTGGFVGLKKIVNSEEKERVKEEIKDELTKDLFKEASKSLADGFVLYQDALFIEFQDLPDENVDDKVLVRQKAILYGVLFDRQILSEYIAAETLTDYPKGNVLIENLDDLDFTVLDKSSTKPWLSGEITFTILGNPLIVWQFDENKLREESAGKLKKEIRAIMTSYSSILKAEIQVSPFWKRRLPENPERIRIIRKVESEG